MNLEDIQPKNAVIHTQTRRAKLLVELREYFEENRGKAIEDVSECPVCGSGNRHEVFCKAFVVFSRCLECEAIYQSRKVSEGVRDAMYARSEYFDLSAQGVHAATHENRKVGKSVPILDRLTAFADPNVPLRLLDVGCATGNFLELVAERTAWLGQGVEINQGAAEFARSRGLDIVLGNAMHVDWPLQSFDIIVCLGLIGRIATPRAFAARCAELLSPNGILLITTPNCNGFEMAVIGEHHLYYDPLDTPCGYTRRSIELLLESAGMRILSFTTPGEMDVEIVRRHAIDLNLPVSMSDFERTLLLSEEPRMDAVRAAFGRFLTTNGLSGLMEIVSHKPSKAHDRGGHVL
ncbi:MAG: class I SAM-dependent methyltransferase [Thermodesulfobacteriota bacterium]